MTGEARSSEEPYAFAAALNRATEGLQSRLERLTGAAQARLRRAPRSAPRPVPAGASVIPTVRYRDVPKAVEWLCRAFGMRVHRVVPDAAGAPRYAELTVGSGMLMVAPIEDTPFGKLMVQPDEIGGVETQVCYLCVGNARAHYKRAKAAGAVIVLHPDDDANRGRGYSCRDPEGHVWNFGTYDPWAGQAPAMAPARPLSRGGWRAWQAWRPGRLLQGLAVLVLLAAASLLLSELVPQPSARAGTAAVAPLSSPAPASIDEPRPARSALAVAAATNPAEPERQEHRAAVEAAERMAAAARAEMASIRAALEKAERDAATARSQLDEVRRAREAADRATAEARASLAAAQRTVESARAEAVQERARRLAADRAAAARRRTTVNLVRSRARWSRSWCYNPTVPSPAPSAAGRLTGFCKT